MIKFETKLKIIDNSGAKVAVCIKLLGGSKRQTSSIGDLIVVAVKNALPRRKVKKGDVCKALIVRTKKEKHRCDGISFRFDDNAAILLNNQLVPIGTRIFGPVTRELRRKKWMKVISLASNVI